MIDIPPPRRQWGEFRDNKVIATPSTGITIMWAGNDEAGNMSQPRAFGVAECSTEIGADMPGIRAPLPNSMGRWARVMLGAITLLFACIGAGSVVAYIARGL